MKEAATKKKDKRPQQQQQREWRRKATWTHASGARVCLACDTV